MNAPRLTAFAMMATNVALATNYWRSSKEERDRINLVIEDYISQYPNQNCTE